MQQSRQMSGARSVRGSTAPATARHIFCSRFPGGEIIYIADVGKKQSAGGSQVNFPTSDVPNEVVPRAGGPAVATTRVSPSSERERELG
jgi:hypothetical protein